MDFEEFLEELKALATNERNVLAELDEPTFDELHILFRKAVQTFDREERRRKQEAEYD